MASSTERSRNKSDTGNLCRPVSSKSRRHKKSEDPIFTQPYIPSTVSTVAPVLANEIALVKKIDHLRYGRHKKQLPALLIAPIVEKCK
jgi:hypothetical protein